MMDTRAGALTEAKNLEANPYALQDDGQHSNIKTTSRYSRDRSEGANTVVQMRQAR